MQETKLTHVQGTHTRLYYAAYCSFDFEQVYRNLLNFEAKLKVWYQKRGVIKSLRINRDHVRRKGRNYRSNSTITYG